MPQAKKPRVRRLPQGGERRSSFPPADACEAGMVLIMRQMVFLRAVHENPGWAPLAPRFGIDSEFWGRGCGDTPLRMVLEADKRRGM